MKKQQYDIIINLVFTTVFITLFFWLGEQLESWYLSSKGVSEYGNLSVKEALYLLPLSGAYIVGYMICLASFVITTNGQGNFLKRIVFLFELYFILFARLTRKRKKSF